MFFSCVGNRKLDRIRYRDELRNFRRRDKMGKLQIIEVGFQLPRQDENVPVQKEKVPGRNETEKTQLGMKSVCDGRDREKRNWRIFLDKMKNNENICFFLREWDEFHSMAGQ